jgi:dolichol-phosphate mannosyltransferase
VFVVHSLVDQTKLNWTGPVWLVLLPWIAGAMIARPARAGARILGQFRRVWGVTIAALVVFYPAGLIWILIGAPGQPAASWYKLPIAWDAFGQAVEQVETQVETETGREPLIAGMDNYWIASEGRFYDYPDGDSLPEFTGRNVIGQNALMWSRWFNPDELRSRPVILVGFSAREIEQADVARSFATLGPVTEQTVIKHSRTIGRFFWRLASDPVQNEAAE